MTIILGIDPGSRKTGFGLISSLGSTQEYIASGTIHIDTTFTLPERLKVIFDSVTEIIQEYSPQEMAIESVFVSKNASSALKLGQARGAAIVAGVNQELPVSEYEAKKIKQAVVGTGSADKAQVQHMVKILLKLPTAPKEDAADALAVALCHASSHRGLIATAHAKSFSRGRLN